MIHWRRLEDSEADRLLREKLIEESQEIVTATNREELLAEMADLLELFEGIRRIHGISKSEVEEAQRKKKEARGGYEGQRYVSLVVHPEGSFGCNYCLHDPIKYPEIPLEAPMLKR